MAADSSGAQILAADEGKPFRTSIDFYRTIE